MLADFSPLRDNKVTGYHVTAERMEKREGNRVISTLPLTTTLYITDATKVDTAHFL